MVSFHRTARCNVRRTLFLRIIKCDISGRGNMNGKARNAGSSLVSISEKKKIEDLGLDGKIALVYNVPNIVHGCGMKLCESG